MKPQLSKEEIEWLGKTKPSIGDVVEEMNVRFIVYYEKESQTMKFSDAQTRKDFAAFGSNDKSIVLENGVYIRK